MKKDKLFTVNKWNKPMFVSNKNILKYGSPLGGLSPQQMADLREFNLSANMTPTLTTSSLGMGTLAPKGGLGSLSETDPSKFFGTDAGASTTKGGLLNNGALKEVGTGLAAAGIGMLGNAAGNAIAGGKTSKVGNMIGSVGSAALGMAGTAIGGPLGGAVGSALGSTLGGLANAAFGSELNEQKISEVESNNAQREAENNALYGVNSTDDLINSVSNMTNAMAFNQGDIGDDGWFSSDAEDKYDELKAQQEQIDRMRGVAIGTATGKVNRNQYINSMKNNLTAFGGKLFADGGLKAAFFDEFGKDPIGAAVRYNRGLEAMAAEREAREAEAAREAEYADMQKRLLQLETSNQGLQALMAAQSVPATTETTEETAEPLSTPSAAAYNSNWDYIEDQLKRSGKFNDVQIQGIKYNLQRESGIGQFDGGDNGTARGLAQWRGDRIPKDMSLEGQTRYLIDTLSNYDGKLHWIGEDNYKGFMNARTPEEAHYYITKGYERPHKDIVAKVKRDSDMSLKNINAFGGELGTNGTDWTNGLLEINEGGSHESNPLEGVPMGLDPEGIPNLVEEGETVYNDYVFSDRMWVPFFMYKELGLGGAMKKKGKQMSFADASKKLAQESEQRPNDPISQAGLDASLARLAEVQEAERMRKQGKEYMGLDGYACGGKLGNKYSGTNPRGQKMKTKQVPKGQSSNLPVIKKTVPSEFGLPQNNYETDYPWLFGDIPSTQTLSPMEQIARDKSTPSSTVSVTDNGTNFSRTPVLASEDRGISDNGSGSSTPIENEEGVPTYPTWMRYAPAIGSGSMAFTDALGLTNRPDYTYADKLEAAASRAGIAPNIGFRPIDGRLAYNPMDIWFQQNRMDANARATANAIQNNAGPLGTKIAGMLALDHNNQIADGQLYRNALEYNDAQKERVAAFNLKPDMFNSQMGLEAAMANARYNQAGKQMGLSGLAQAASMRDAIDQRVGAARSANLTNFLTSLGNIGRENFAMNQLNWDKSRHYDTDASGRSGYKKKASCGGKLNHK